MVADLRLGGGGINRLRQLIRLPQSFRQLDAAHSAVLLIAGPAAAGDISPHYTLHGQHLQFTAHHAVAVKTLLPEKLRHILYIH